MKRAGKVSLVLILALVLSLGLMASVWAQSIKQGPGGINLTPKQAGRIFDLMEKLHTDTLSLRKQMFIKTVKLEALSNSAKPDKKAIQAKQKELNALRNQFKKKIMAYLVEAKKIAPKFNLGMTLGVVPPPPSSAPAK